MSKRLLDLAAAVAGLVLLWPLLALIALAVKLDSPGPALFRQVRVGAWLRATKLDELPQFFNVLRGEMSLVGPRPEVPRYVALYPPDVRALVLSVRPGITDEASIEFRDESELLAGAPDPEAAYVRDILPRKLEIYVRYASDHSMAGDLRILWRTALRVLRVGGL